MKKLLPLLLCMLFSVASFAQKPYTLNADGLIFTLTCSQMKEHVYKGIRENMKSVNEQLPLQIGENSTLRSVTFVGNSMKFSIWVDVDKSVISQEQTLQLINNANALAIEYLTSCFQSLSNIMPPSEWKRLFTELGVNCKYLFYDCNGNLFANYTMYAKDMDLSTSSPNSSSLSAEEMSSNSDKGAKSGYKTYDCKLFSFKYPASLKEGPEDDDESIVLSLLSHDFGLNIACLEYKKGDCADIWEDNVVNETFDEDRDQDGFKTKKVEKIHLMLGENDVRALRIDSETSTINGYSCNARGYTYFVAHKGYLLMFSFVSTPNDGDYSRFEELLRGVTLK